MKKLYDIAALRESLKNEVIELVNQKFTEYQKSQGRRGSTETSENQTAGTETDKSES